MQNNSDSLPKLRLNYGRTMLIGLAFMTIMMLWQVYNQTVSIFLSNLLSEKLGTENVSYIVGIIMALDNALALFMLPLFGKLSDKTSTPIGKRMPFIIGGTFFAALAFVFIPVMYFNKSLVGMVVMIALVVLSMNIYRSPAVALMPDVTVKPLRSKANGIINLMGGIGGGLMMLVMMLLGTSKGESMFGMSFPFYLAAGLMIVGIVALFLCVRENKLSREMRELTERYGFDRKEEARGEGGVPDADLSKNIKKNFLLILGAVFLWFMAFNAIETFFSLYCQKVLCVADKANFMIDGVLDQAAYDAYARGKASTIMLCFQVAAMAAYIPAGFLASRFGRKAVILCGIGLTVVMFGIAVCFSAFSWALLPFFIIAGFAYAAINVNSYPMVLEMSDSTNIGKYTGYYYTASMLAQTVTPILIGVVLDVIGYRYAFFPYAAIFMAAAFAVFLFVGKGKKPTDVKRGLESFDTD